MSIVLTLHSIVRWLAVLVALAAIVNLPWVGSKNSPSIHPPGRWPGLLAA